MSDQRESYWPTDFGVETEITPLTILKEQAVLLGERTKNVVKARVQTKLDEKMEVRHSLYLIVPTLGNYRYFLLSVHHKPEIYPIRIFDGTTDRELTAFSLDQFKEKLREILSSDRVRRIIGNLLTYATAPSSA